jgi:apolipoprotein N-acyltransferase
MATPLRRRSRAAGRRGMDVAAATPAALGSGSRDAGGSQATPPDQAAREAAGQDQGASVSAVAIPGGRRWWRRLVAFALGMPLALAFPRPSLWWLAFVGLVPLLLLVRAAPDAREAGVRAWLGGTGFFLTVGSWLLPVVQVFLLPAALVLAVLWTPWGRLAWRLLHGPARPRQVAAALVLLPSVWLVGEAVRSWEALGGSWALLGASQWNARLVLQVASLGGVWLLSFLLVAVNVGLAVALGSGLRWPARLGGSLAAGLLVAAMVGYGVLRDPAPASRSSPSARLALVQPGIVHQVEPRFRASESLSRQVAGARPDLIVWPESSVGRDPATTPGDVARLGRIVQATGAPVLANVDARRRSGGIYKTSLLVGPDRPLSRYDKLRLVPFGEYVPARPLLGWVTKVSQAAAEDRHRGTRLVAMRAGRLSVGPLICFESSFPDLSRSLANLGVDLVVVQSATTTFQQTWGPDQHAALGAVRAVESGRPVVQASIAGVSAAFDGRGRRLAWAPTSYRGAVLVDVPLTRETTPYSRFGDWVPTGSAALLLAAALADAAARRRRAAATA